MPSAVRKILDNARGFVRTGHGFPFSFYGSAETVFWPGCGFSANRPRLVRRLRGILSRQLRKPVEFALDCCHDPVYGLGDTPTAFAGLKEIEKRLRDHGVRQVITGCLNCHKLLSQHLEGIRVVFILEVLPADLFRKQPGPVYLHHPCPSSRWEPIRKKARGLIDPVRPEAAQSVPQDSPLCCGSGGGLNVISPDLADRFLDRIIGEAEQKTIVTYCTGCQDRFLKKGMDAVHLLECLPGVKPRRKVSSTLRQWVNRLTLAMSERMKTGRFLTILVLAVLLGCGIYLNTINIFSTVILTDLLGRHPVLAPLIFLGIYAIAPALFLPSIPLTLAAGFFWGPLWGVIFSISGATIGACLSFFLSRYLFREAIKKRVPPERWEWLQKKVMRHGWKAVAFTRLIPAFPFELLNYLFGLTPIPFRHYLWSTFIFMLPACIAFVAFGSSLGELIIHGHVKGVVLGVIVAACALFAALALRPWFRKIGKDDANHAGHEPGKRKEP